MEIKGTRTEELLKRTFVAELKFSFRYFRIAEAARKEKLDYVADLFEATAQNELEHARHQFEFLGSGGDMSQIISEAIHDEGIEATRTYPEAAAVAEREGFSEVAGLFKRLALVEARHKEHFLEALDDMRKGLKPRGRTVGNSAVEMALVMQPAQANSGGFIHGGELMKLMDDAAAVVAARHCGTSIVTGNVEDIKFLRPVSIGDLLMIHARITFVSHSSMEIKIEVETEGIFSAHSRNRYLVLSALFVMVAVDSSGKALPVPPLICSTEEEEKSFQEGCDRYEARKTKNSL